MLPASRLDSLTAAASERRAASGTDGTRRTEIDVSRYYIMQLADRTTQYMCRWAEVTEM